MKILNTERVALTSTAVTLFEFERRKRRRRSVTSLSSTLIQSGLAILETHWPLFILSFLLMYVCTVPMYCRVPDCIELYCKSDTIKILNNLR